MAITVTFSSAFQDLTHGRRAFSASGDRLSAILRHVDRQVPGLRAKLFDAQGRIHPAYQVILIRGKSQELCQDLDCKMEDGDEVVISPVITGGE